MSNGIRKQPSSHIAGAPLLASILASAWLLAGCGQEGGTVPAVDMPVVDTPPVVMPPTMPQTCVAACAENIHCEYGNVCRNGCCTPGCDTDADCDGGRVCLAGSCQDPATAPPDGGPGSDAPPVVNGEVGSPCSGDEDCQGGTCLQLPGGYCTQMDCEAQGCPEGSACFGLQGGSSACFRSCTDSAECRTGEGYVCDGDNTCYPGDPTNPNMGGPCSPQNLTGTCPAGQVCVEGTCAVFECRDTSFEPNDTAEQAKPAPVGTTNGIDLCAGEDDWYLVDVPPGMIATVGAIHQRTSGDLDLTVYNAAGQCLGGRPQHYCGWSNFRDYETNEEFLSVANLGASGNRTFRWKLEGLNNAGNRYSLVHQRIPWIDGPSCTEAGFPQDECEGRPGGRVGLIQFPMPDPSDPYVPDGYRFDSMANYRWLRRETIMLVRHAIRAVQQKFPGTKPLGLIDMCQRDGITPGYDVNSPRHPETTHDQGGNIDIAYYNKLAAQGSLAYSEGFIVCDAQGGSNDGYYCNASAAQTHVVDLPRQVYFMATLFTSPRTRVIGVDRVIAPLLQQEAERQFQAGDITRAQRDAFYQKMAYGDGWPFHHHHMHLSLYFWGQTPLSGQLDAWPGCGFDLMSHKVRQAAIQSNFR